VSRPVDWQPLAGADPVPGDPVAVQGVARQYRYLADELGAQVSVLQRIADDKRWDADAGRVFAAQVHGFCTDLGRVRSRFEAVAGALAGYAPRLAEAQQEADAALLAARSAETVIRSNPSTTPATSVRRYELDTASLDLSAADRRLQQAVQVRDAAAQRAGQIIRAQLDGPGPAQAGPIGVTRPGDEHPAGLGVPGWLPGVLRDLGFLPAEGQGPINDLLWGLALTGTGLGMATDWMSKAVYGRFQARIGNKFGPGAANLTPWERFKFSFDERSWHAGPNQALRRARWNTTGEWVGRAGVGLSFASAAMGQWSADSRDRSIDTGAKVARAATVGAATAAGAWAGAEGGAMLGGAIGTAIAPGPGTVVGAAVGGIVGGFAGSAAGGWVGNEVKAGVGDAVDWGEKAIGDATDWSQSAVSSVGNVFGL
jgi:hypothetical protein